MKILKQSFMQGDVQAYSIDKIPPNAKKIEKRFIAASERSGSVHALFGNYDQYEVEDGVCIDVKEDCILNHTLKQNLVSNSLDKAEVLTKKDHRHTIVKKGLYYVGIHEKFDPLTGFKEKMKD